MVISKVNLSKGEVVCLAEKKCDLGMNKLLISIRLYISVFTFYANATD